jgi:hypothetical protein
MPSAHYHGTNAEITIFKGFCEIVNSHHHPIFLILGIDQTKKKFWLITQVLDEDNGHAHALPVSDDDMKQFIETGEMNVETQKDAHIHHVYFTEDDRQGFVVDPLEILRDIEESKMEEEMEED